jgi:hypothetical protein
MDESQKQKQLGFHPQAIISLATLAILVAVCVSTDLTARNRPLERWLMTQSRSLAEQINKLFSDTGNFIDFEDRVLLDEIPHTDYSKGGVYFFGTSNMKWAFQTWDLPATQKRLIGNYGISASNHTTQLQLIRYLIDQRGFFSAGNLNLVIFGVSFHLGVEPSNFFEFLLRRHGLFTINADGQVFPTQVNPIGRWLSIEKARSGGVFWNVGRVTKSYIEWLTGWFHPEPRDPAQYQEMWRLYMGPNWKPNMDDQIEEFRKTILLVRSYGATVKVILLPQGTWMDSVPFKPYYEVKIRSLCSSTSTALIDLSRSIPDNDFVDSNHLTVQGQQAFRKLIMEIIDGHLQKVMAANARSQLN